jgi:uncharacterized RDD family membrane protein YckC
LVAVVLHAIIFALPLLVFLGSDALGEDEDYFSFEAIVAEVILSAIAGAICYPLLSGHIGHRIMGLKVISAENGRDINKATEGALREAIKSALGNLLIPLIWLLWDDHRQNLYDKVVKTLVVKRSTR